MKNFYFLPNWYVENKREEKTKSLKFFIVLFLVINLLLVDLMIINKTKFKNISNEIEDTINLNSSKSKTKLNSSKNTRTLESFSIFLKMIEKNITIKNVHIENKNIDIEVEGNEKDCFSLIKNIEGSNKFIVKKLSSKEEVDKSGWKINLQLR